MTAAEQLRACIERLDPQLRKTVRSVRAALRKRFPTANELVYDYGTSLVISYSPTERGIEGLVALSARGTVLSLYFQRGLELPDPTRVLKGSGRATRSLEVPSADRLAEPEVEALLAAAEVLAPVSLPARGRGRLLFKPTAAQKRRRGESGE